jgi:phage baseplate assembly protein W
MANKQLGLVQKTRIIRKPFFVGFNTIDQPNPPYSLTNVDLVKRDILNHFATPLGARVMLPNFGTRIYEMLFDEYTKGAIIDDAIRVVQTDPRVELVSIDAYQEDQALNIILVLLFKPESITDNMFVTFSLKNKETF